MSPWVHVATLSRQFGAGVAAAIRQPFGATSRNPGLGPRERPNPNELARD
jgi:hypothetical protein